MPAPFGPTMPMRSPRWIRIEKLSTILRSPKDLADGLGLDHQLARFFGLRSSEIGIARGPAIIPPLLAQRMKIAEPLDIALAPAGDAVAQPVLFIDDFAVELVLLALFLREHLIAPGFKGAEAAIDLPDLAAIEPGGGARQVGEEAAIVADDDQRRAAAVELAFQPFDGRKIEMVGGLVQQQDVGRGRQYARQRRAAGLAAGELHRLFVAAKRELLQEIARLIAVVARAETGFDIGKRCRRASEIRLLRQIADGRARLHEAAAAIGFDYACRDLQQRRLARAVAPDQADALGRRHRKLDTCEQRRAAKGELDVLQLDQRRRHGSVLMWRRLLCPLALDAADGLVERRQEHGAVARCERFWAASDFAR